ncbi:MAG: FKBP-type peptidyl-prolyl cis-trans isomerase [Zoogloeaceae bacterium]|nr:FKBP-type peptidyl-prolyl cis-trans isomerase [Zoogloeaceae bacterium]
MNRPLLLAIGIALVGSGTGAVAADMSEEQKTLYALGRLVARQTAVFQLSAEELATVQQGWRDAVTGADSAVDMNVYATKVNELATARRQAAAQKVAEEGKAVVAAAAAEAGAIKAESGFVYLPLTEGDGAQPSGSDVVKVHYRGTLTDGTEFDSSYKRGEMSTFPLDGVIKCWSQGVAMMKVGGKARLTCPADTAYGDRGAGAVIPPGATLIFEVELAEVVSKK